MTSFMDDISAPNPAPAASFPPALGFRREEEAALTALLRGPAGGPPPFSVPTAPGNPAPLNVNVWWNMPAREQRVVTYPYILLRYLGVDWRREEEHRGYNLPTDYEADTANALTGAGPNEAGPVGVMASYPIPVYLRYQVTVFSRLNLHDVLLEQQLMADGFFPPRFGILNCPAGVTRRLDVLEMARPADIIENGQRTFRKVWTIQISSEVTSPVDLIVAASNVDLQITQIPAS